MSLEIGCVALKLVCINQFKEAIKREAINKNKVFLAHSLSNNVQITLAIR